MPEKQLTNTRWDGAQDSTSRSSDPLGLKPTLGASEFVNVPVAGFSAPEEHGASHADRARNMDRQNSSHTSRLGGLQMMKTATGSDGVLVVERSLLLVQPILEYVKSLRRFFPTEDWGRERACYGIPKDWGLFPCVREFTTLVGRCRDTAFDA